MPGKAGVGIRGMRERIRQLGGGLEIISAGKGKGTAIVARLPIDRSLICLALDRGIFANELRWRQTEPSLQLGVLNHLPTLIRSFAAPIRH